MIYFDKLIKKSSMFIELNLNLIVKFCKKIKNTFMIFKKAIPFTDLPYI